MDDVQVLQVIDSLGAGGAERSLLETAPVLRDHGVRLHVVALASTTVGFEAEFRAAGVDVRVLPRRGRAAALRALHRLVSTSRPDVVHTTLFEADVLGRLAVHGRVPLLTSLVNTSYDPVRLADPGVSRLGLQAARIIDSWTARRLTTHFHALTEAVRVAAVRDLHIEPDRVTVVPRGRDASRFAPRDDRQRAAIRRALDLPEDARVVLNVARREFQKGQSTLVHAIARLHAQGRPVVLLVAGREGSASGALADLRAELGLDDVVHFLGHRPDVADLFAVADVFAFPSLYEGLGNAVLEAMASGTPVVASDLPAIREVLPSPDCGVLVPPQDPGALANGLAALLDDDPRRGRMARTARRRFDEHHSLAEVSRRMADLYRLVAAVPASGHAGIATAGYPR